MYERAAHIFFPFAMAKTDAARQSGMRFVHYSGAEAALGMLRNREVWMRKSSCMNDFSEVQHGRHCLLETWHGPTGRRFQGALNNLFPGVCEEITRLFDHWLPHFE